MLTPAPDPPVAQLVDPQEALDVVRLPDGASITFLTAPEEGAPCVMRGTIPPGGFVPLHSHADPETFLAVSGQADGLAMTAPDDFTWIPIGPGDVFHVPDDAKHAWRNQWPEPFVTTIISTARLGLFFREIGTPAATTHRTQSPPSEAALRTFLEVGNRYGYWNATPEQNASIGFPMPPATSAP
jgi:quercetin dioxygenase-like cupin family protein